MSHRQALALIACLSSASLGAAEQTLQIDRLEVEDGDTLIAEIDGGGQRLQLAYIDAPEDQDNPKLRYDMQRTGLDAEMLLKLGEDATAHLRGLTADAGPFTVRLDTGVRDRYGRITADVADGSGCSLSAAMVQDGYALVQQPRKPGDPTPPPALVQDETEARTSGRGIWGTSADAATVWGGAATQ